MAKRILYLLCWIPAGLLFVVTYMVIMPMILLIMAFSFIIKGDAYYFDTNMGSDEVMMWAPDLVERILGED